MDFFPLWLIKSQPFHDTPALLPRTKQKWKILLQYYLLLLKITSFRMDVSLWYFLFIFLQILLFLLIVYWCLFGGIRASGFALRIRKVQRCSKTNLYFLYPFPGLRVGDFLVPLSNFAACRFLQRCLHRIRQHQQWIKPPSPHISHPNSSLHLEIFLEHPFFMALYVFFSSGFGNFFRCA